MGFEHLNWLIFIVVAALSTLVGSFAVIGIWITGQPQQVTDDADWGALHGLYALTAAVGIEACSIGLELWGGLRTEWVSGVPVMNILDLVMYGIVVALLGIALIAARNVRTLLARDVRIWVRTLLTINVLGGGLFLLSELNR